MNNQRRKEINNVKEEIKFLLEKTKMVKTEIERIQDDEQDYLDNMPENLQYSMRAEDSQEAIDNFGDAIDCLDEVIDYLNEII